jgi:hypothetical protein
MCHFKTKLVLCVGATVMENGGEDGQIWGQRACMLFECVFEHMSHDMEGSSAQDICAMLRLPKIIERAVQDQDAGCRRYLRMLPGFPMEILDSGAKRGSAGARGIWEEKHGYLQMQFQESWIERVIDIIQEIDRLTRGDTPLMSLFSRHYLRLERARMSMLEAEALRASACEAPSAKDGQAKGRL